MHKHISCFFICVCCDAYLHAYLKGSSFIDVRFKHASIISYMVGVVNLFPHVLKYNAYALNLVVF